MKADIEINEDAVRKCPYASAYTGHLPWVQGYTAAAKEYEAQLDRLRELLRKVEARGER